MPHTRRYIFNSLTVVSLLPMLAAVDDGDHLGRHRTRQALPGLGQARRRRAEGDQAQRRRLWPLARPSALRQ